MTTIAIIGAGSLGSALAHELTARGHEARVISRGDAHGQLPSSVGHLRADARDTEALTKAIQGADIVIQTSQPVYTRWAQEFPQLQRSILAATERAGARIVLADNLYMYGRGDNGVIADATPERPCSVKGEVRKAMADEALEAHTQGRLQVALTRPSNYVGAGYELSRRLLLDPARAGKPMKVLGSLEQPHSFTYLPDAVRAMADIALADDAYGRAWITPAMQPVTQQQLCDALWAAAGNDGPAKVQAIRGAGLRALALVNPLLKASIEMMYEFDEPYEVRATDFEARFGWSGTSLISAASESMTGGARLA
ncbi:NAD-dependent epimerase/dehydratase family protein [Demequina sp.]|uniref:NAD-dependent epimerase/dehydratase family protein n=1 Tax=Demequina sp. TaxID=2050685 RepID=UPI003D14948C